MGVNAQFMEHIALGLEIDRHAPIMTPVLPSPRSISLKPME
jgi:hypothetical protein